MPFVRVLTSPELAIYPQPTIFLAGPIQGARNWQGDAIMYLQEMAGVAGKAIVIANPRRSDFPENAFEEQVAWETHYLEQASKNGVVLFWLEREQEHLCERSYAQTTRYELGEHMTKRTKIALGIDEGFTGAKYIMQRSRVPVYTSLQSTCAEAIHIMVGRIRPLI